MSKEKKKMGGWVDQWEASNWSCDQRVNERPKKIAWEGDKETNNDNTRTSRLLDQLGPEGWVGENTPHSLFLSSFKNVFRPPLGQGPKERYLYFGWLPWLESCWGQGIPWTKRKSNNGHGLIISFTEGRDDFVMHCSQCFAHYGGYFWKEKERGGGVDKLKSGCRDPFFLWWKLLPNLPGIQSLEALLLFVKEQCGFCRHYTILNLVSSSLTRPGVARAVLQTPLWLSY